MVASCSAGLEVQQTPLLKQLFERLQMESTTDEATAQFLELKPDSNAHELLAQRLPTMIGEAPNADKRHVWLNSVRLSGEFRIAEAVPALTKCINSNTGATSGGLYATMHLLGFPCAQALIHIGDPAVPELRELLQKGNSRYRWFAYRTLFLIGSPPAIGALRDHLNRENDRELKAEIQQALNEKK